MMLVKQCILLYLQFSPFPSFWSCPGKESSFFLSSTLFSFQGFPLEADCREVFLVEVALCLRAVAAFWSMLSMVGLLVSLAIKLGRVFGLASSPSEDSGVSLLT